MSIIQIDHLTKDYGHNRGVFDISLYVQKGEVYGFLGPNGAGKTTAIRHIMGFSRPQKGLTIVNGLNSWKNASEIQKNLGYLPGEIAFPENLTGKQFIKMMAELRGIKEMTYTSNLMEEIRVNPSGSVKRMSLGIKRKLAIVTAFMHDPDILILDEPTSGLDPMMQDVFIEFIREEKERGKTILLSSHIFNEIDATCDKISIIKDGKIISTVIADDLRNNEDKTFEIEFLTKDDFNLFSKKIQTYPNFEVVALKPKKKQAKVRYKMQISIIYKLISKYELKFFSEIKFTLEDYFMKFYERNQGLREEQSNGTH